MRHALEADHVAAVAALATKSTSVKSAIKQGAVWGLGHTITLFLFSTIVIMTDSIVPEKFANGLEFIVGIMLVSEGGHLAHIKLAGLPVEPMSKTTFYFVLIILVAVDVVQSQYRKRLSAQHRDEINNDDLHI
jgi:high-affinity nickel permease